MDKIKITTDSASDLNELFRSRDIGEFPLYVMLGDKQYLDDIDITPQMIFDYFDKYNKLPNTAARSIEDFYSFFKSFTDDGYSVIHIAISSEISSTYDYASVAASRLDNVTVIDGKSLSSGTGLLVLTAADMRDKGFSVDEIISVLNEKRENVQASFMIDTLDFLYKGGRCNGLSAIFGKALSIKPSLYLKDGKICVGKKYIGNFNIKIIKYVETTLQTYNSPDLSRVFITHTHASPDVVESVRQKLIDYGFDPNGIITTIAGSTITSHCGKNTLGILYINDGATNNG